MRDTSRQGKRACVPYRPEPWVLDRLHAKKSMCARAEERLRTMYTELDRRLGEENCFFCLGAEGCMTKENSSVYECGHAFHSRCLAASRDFAFNQVEIMSARMSNLRHEADDGSDPVRPSRVVFGLECGLCRAAVTAGSVGPVVPLPPVCPLAAEGCSAKDANDYLSSLQLREKTAARMQALMDGTYVKQPGDEDLSNAPLEHPIAVGCRVA